MLKKLLTAVILSLLLAACSKPPTNQQLTDAIKKLIPSNIEVLQVNELKAVPSLYEVVVKVNNQPVVLYVDRKAQYVFSGSLVSLDNKLNLTMETQKKFMQKQ